jgi:hypothetical protein
MALRSGNSRSDERRAERRATRAASTLRADGVAGPIDVLVLDISSTGARIVTPAVLAVGQEISIGLAGAGVTRAFVAWRDADHYGCAFEAPIGAEATARAFSSAAIVRLGQPRALVQGSGETDLRALYRQHRFWALPADAIAAMMVLLGGAAVLAWLYL